MTAIVLKHCRFFQIGAAFSANEVVKDYSDPVEVNTKGTKYHCLLLKAQWPFTDFYVLIFCKGREPESKAEHIT